MKGNSDGFDARAARVERKQVELFQLWRGASPDESLRGTICKSRKVKTSPMSKRDLKGAKLAGGEGEAVCTGRRVSVSRIAEHVERHRALAAAARKRSKAE